jgi:hypothetical protein
VSKAAAATVKKTDGDPIQIPTGKGEFIKSQDAGLYMKTKKLPETSNARPVPSNAPLSERLGTFNDEGGIAVMPHYSMRTSLVCLSIL